MKIVGCDLHARQQTIAMLDTETGEFTEKNDRRDARLILDLLLRDRFPAIWMPSTEQRDLRTLLRDRHQWVKMRSRLQHTLQAIALNHALRKGSALWSQAGQTALQALPLAPYTSQRRAELLSLYSCRSGSRSWTKRWKTKFNNEPRHAGW
jgi:transposase